VSKTARLAELAAVFLRLGCISFGGAVAHLGYFHEEFVRRRKWLEEAHYSDLVALCNFLPGPASSQTVFAIGMERAGLAGALTASLAFLLPSAGLMILFGYGFSAFGGARVAGLLHGLKIAAAAVVAQAVWSMARRLCPDFPRALLALAAAAFVFAAPGAYAQIGSIAAGLAVGVVFFKGPSSTPMENSPTNSKLKTSHYCAAAALAVYAGLLFILPVLATESGARSFKVFAGFYRVGALVFGGGHVLLPLLRAEVVPPGWIGDGPFLAGYGAAQALPGPMFSFAAYLGTMIFAGPRAWLGGLLCLAAIYLPAWLVIGGALPFWHSLRGQSWAQGALRGANAAVVGILFAALINPIGVEAIGNWRDLAAALVALLLLEKFRVPPWAVVLLAAAWGGFA
jgi:chromate transporter